MSKDIEIRIPDLGQDQAVAVIDILVTTGDRVDLEESLLTLETDKASLDVPAPCSGVISELKCRVGDHVTSGDLVAILHDAEMAGDNTSVASEVVSDVAASVKVDAEVAQAMVEVPDMGQGAAVGVIEIHVAKGDQVQKEDPLVTLEGDKATMDIPAPYAGEVVTVEVSVGSQVSPGMALVALMGASSGAKKTADAVKEAPAATKPEPVASAKAPIVSEPVSAVPTSGEVYASPAVRRTAWEFGVDLRQVTGSGRKGRLLLEDVQRFVKAALQQPASAGRQTSTKARPGADHFAKFGEVDVAELSRIKQLTGKHMSYCWQDIPQVTHFDEADITDLENYRQRHKAALAKQGYRLTPLVFVMKALARTLADFPNFNASLDPSEQSLIIKKYCHIGVAVDTPQGLVVPVVRDVDRKGLLQLSQELTELSEQARQGALKPQQMQGGSFTLSSLGGIGGTAFTPIVNAPEVAILGLSKSYQKPFYHADEDRWEPSLMLPFSLSYDHRIIDGAQAARFCQQLGSNLTDLVNILL